MMCGASSSAVGMTVGFPSFSKEGKAGAVGACVGLLVTIRRCKVRTTVSLRYYDEFGHLHELLSADAFIENIN